MNPQRATLVDLLDRLLDHGVVLDADVLISVAGVPLIALSLRAALAGVNTMRRYGLMRDWLETPSEGVLTASGSPHPASTETLPESVLRSSPDMIHASRSREPTV